MAAARSLHVVAELAGPRQLHEKERQEYLIPQHTATLSKCLGMVNWQSVRCINAAILAQAARFTKQQESAT